MPDRIEDRRQQAPAVAAAAPTYAAVDLGSNSFHLLVAREDHGLLHVLDRQKEMLRLADGLDQDGYLSLEARERALPCLARFGQRLRHLPTQQVRVVGTSTLRRAVNAGAFLAAAENALGHPVEVISGFEEARLIYRGVGYGLDPQADTRMVIDIGGGSTEFVRGEGDLILASESVGLGCVGLSRTWFADGRITRKRWKGACEAAALELQGLPDLLNIGGAEEFVGSSGTIRTAAAIARRAHWCGRDLDRQAVLRIGDALLEAGHADRLQAIAGLSERRHAVIAGGIALLTACFEVFGIAEMRIARHALREGVLLDLARRTRNEDSRQATIEALMVRYGVDRRQAERVGRVALRLFDEVSAAWNLQPRHRLCLHWAAQVHELGLAVSHSKYHEHGAYLLLHSDMAGFSQQEQALLATLVQSHRRQIRIVDDSATLPAHDRNERLRLCVLLRLAVLLSRGREGNVGPDIHLQVDTDRLTLAFPPDWLDAHPLTCRDLEREAEYLDKVGIRLAVI